MTTVAAEPIFKSTSQALHVSFLIHSLPATTKSPTQAVIERLVKENHVWDGLQVPSSSSVNFSGLSPLEVRAQCAQVVSIVNNMGNPAESAALKAIYGHQVIKADGVRYLSVYLEPLLPSIEGRAIGKDRLSATLYLGWHCMSKKHQREGITLAWIAEQAGVSLRTMSSLKRDFDNRVKFMHERAVDAINQRFIEGGLVEDEG